jgi:hypothetical protein
MGQHQIRPFSRQFTAILKIKRAAGFSSPGERLRQRETVLPIVRDRNAASSRLAG